MRRFTLKTLLMLSPLLMVVGAYVWTDPFKVLRHYEVYYDPSDSVWVNLDADYVATCLYDDQYERYRYDAIIFGNSRSRYYRVSDWASHLPAGARPFHYDAHNEGLYAMMRKVQYVERQGRPLRHALFVIDRELLSQTSPANLHLNAIAPQLEGGSLTAYGRLHSASLKAWCNLQFIYAYTDARLSNRIKPYMFRLNMLMHPYAYDQRTNEEVQDDVERCIAAGTYYNEPEIRSRFEGAQHPGEISSPLIDNNAKEQLQTIAEILGRQHTNFRVIVSPLYDQIQLNPKDVAMLRQIFGADRVFDFSGVNAITADRHNFYEPYHYTNACASRIMQQIYKK